MTFELKKETYTNRDTVFEEYEFGQKLYIVTAGDISLFHKRTRTHIKDLKADEFFGELAFFTGQVRTATAKCRTFAEVMTLDKRDFDRLCDDSRDS